MDSELVTRTVRVWTGAQWVVMTGVLDVRVDAAGHVAWLELICAEESRGFVLGEGVQWHEEIERTEAS